jgi:hypothetical protein
MITFSFGTSKVYLPKLTNSYALNETIQIASEMNVDADNF